LFGYNFLKVIFYYKITIKGHNFFLPNITCLSKKITFLCMKTSMLIKKMHLCCKNNILSTYLLHSKNLHKKYDNGKRNRKNMIMERESEKTLKIDKNNTKI